MFRLKLSYVQLGNPAQIQFLQLIKAKPSDFGTFVGIHDSWRSSDGPTNEGCRNPVIFVGFVYNVVNAKLSYDLYIKVMFLGNNTTSGISTRFVKIYNSSGKLPLAYIVTSFMATLSKKIFAVIINYDRASTRADVIYAYIHTLYSSSRNLGVRRFIHGRHEDSNPNNRLENWTKTKSRTKSFDFLYVIIPWLGKEYVKITFDNEKVEAEIAEIRELLRDDAPQSSPSNNSFNRSSGSSNEPDVFSGTSQ